MLFLAWVHTGSRHSPGKVCFPLQIIAHLTSGLHSRHTELITKKEKKRKRKVNSVSNKESETEVTSFYLKNLTNVSVVITCGCSVSVQVREEVDSRAGCGLASVWS